jgi:hypothetical protein
MLYYLYQALSLNTDAGTDIPAASAPGYQILLTGIVKFQ